MDVIRCPRCGAELIVDEKTVLDVREARPYAESIDE